MYMGNYRYRNAIIVNTFPVGVALLARAVHWSQRMHYDGVTCREAVEYQGGYMCNNTSSDSKERREHRLPETAHTSIVPQR